MQTETKIEQFGTIVEAKQECIANGKCWLTVQFDKFKATIPAGRGTLDNFQSGQKIKITIETIE